MTITNSKADTSAHIQSLSIGEIKSMFANSRPVEINWTDEDDAEAEKIYRIMDLTDLEYADVVRVLNEPRKAPLGDIEVYCHAMNINVANFIQNALH